MPPENKITVPFHEFHVKMQEIDLAGGFVHRLEVKSPNYILFIRWPEDTAGDVPGDKSETSPVQHESEFNNEEPIA